MKTRVLAMSLLLLCLFPACNLFTPESRLYGTWIQTGSKCDPQGVCEGTGAPDSTLVIDHRLRIQRHIGSMSVSMELLNFEPDNNSFEIYMKPHEKMPFIKGFVTGDDVILVQELLLNDQYSDYLRFERR
jgi:hypothetical protein